jgi:hypothetical protein
MSPWWIVWAGLAASVLTAAGLMVTRAYGVSELAPRTALGCLMVDDPRLPIAETAGLAAYLALGSTLLPALYSVVLPLLGGPGWVSGAALGLVQGGAVIAGLPVLGRVNRAVRAGRIPPPGRFGAGWGRRTAVVVMVTAVSYGAVVGAVLRAARLTSDANLAEATHVLPHLVAASGHRSLQGENPGSIRMFVGSEPSIA